MDALHDAVLGWYRANGRVLAFRGTSDPWAILVSELMAQQTQAARAAEAWQRFMGAFPSPAALAAATPADALRAWRGLGYNRRAIALRAAAIAIVERHGGRVPSDLAALDALPGVGPYTARAVAALAFGGRVGPVDTNVRRVLGRALFDQSPTPPALQRAADELAPDGAAGEWTHALMDVGATLCRPRNPRCGECPLRPSCRFARRARQGDAQAAWASEASGARPPEPRFESTSRWLRGRILDRLRESPADRWADFDGEIGPHGVPAIEVALAAMAREGLVELDGRPRRARLPQA